MSLALNNWALEFSIVSYYNILYENLKKKINQENKEK